MRDSRAGLHRGQEQQMFFWNFIAINQLVLNLLRARELCQREKCSLNLCVYVNTSKISRVRAQAQDWHVIVQIIKTLSWLLERFWPKQTGCLPSSAQHSSRITSRQGSTPMQNILFYVMKQLSVVKLCYATWCLRTVPSPFHAPVTGNFLLGICKMRFWRHFRKEDGIFRILNFRTPFESTRALLNFS